MSSPSPDQDESLRALGQVVNRIRKERGLSQEELARRADLDEAELGLLESGRRNPSWGVIRRISYALELPLEELIRRVEELEGEG